MADILIEVLPQPRIDTLITDAVTGLQRRRTEYRGTVWFGGRPQTTGYGTLAVGRGARIETPFFLPDSLPYRPDPLEDAVVSCTVALQSVAGEGPQILEARAGLVPDPRNAAVCWMQLQVTAAGQVPMAVAYHVIAVVALNALMPTESGA